MTNKLIRILVCFMLAAILTLAMAGCSSCGGDRGNDPAESGSGDRPEYPDIDFQALDTSKYVTLGQYKGMTISILKKQEITEEDVIAKINSDLIASRYTVKVTDRAVTETDTVRITFVGYADGVAFEGGSGTQDYFNLSDKDKFIDGFADGIIGAMPGVENEVNVTFPENYHNKDLAGKPAVFKITVDHIYEAMELTDAIAKELTKGEHTTAQSMVNYYRDRLIEENDTAYDEEKSDKTWSRIFNGVTRIGLPENIVTALYDYEIWWASFYADSYGISVDDFLSQRMGCTRDTLRKRIEENLYTDIIIYAVMKAENITLTDDDYNNYIEISGITEEEWLKDYTAEELREMMLYTKTYDMAVSWQTFVETEPSLG